MPFIEDQNNSIVTSADCWNNLTRKQVVVQFTTTKKARHEVGAAPFSSTKSENALQIGRKRTLSNHAAPDKMFLSTAITAIVAFPAS
jgi:hypothetical protein